RDETGTVGPTGSGTVTSERLTTFGAGNEVELTFGSTSQEFPNPLPVRLLRFEGELRETAVVLHWQTASEDQSSHFEVERSSDGERFASIGRVEAAGTSRATKSYGFTDQQPLSGLSYYRLKTVDRDANYAYSKTIDIHYQEERESVLVYPNPVSAGEPLKMRVLNPTSQSYEVAVYDLRGRLLTSHTYALETGLTERTLSERTDLPKGAYVVLVRNQHGTVPFKLIVR
ncbi:MAG: T9SS type A sorting domain-containing protein, partial [Ferruginibacter sp.]|nr:T9SS type A sorting domain-containing protein [Cytophagales bacterium]